MRLLDPLEEFSTEKLCRPNRRRLSTQRSAELPLSSHTCHTLANDIAGLPARTTLHLSQNRDSLIYTPRHWPWPGGVNGNWRRLRSVGTLLTIDRCQASSADSGLVSTAQSGGLLSVATGTTPDPVRLVLGEDHAQQRSAAAGCSRGWLHLHGYGAGRLQISPRARLRLWPRL